MVDLRRLQAFAKVYEFKSFSRAAQEIFLSQPTVSGHIKSLEQELGLQLFDRLGRRIVPTRGADILYDYTRRILDLLTEAGQALDSFMGRHRGELVLAGSTIPGQYLLPAALGLYRQKYPEVSITLQIADTGQVLQSVLEGKVELGMVGSTSDDERLMFEPLIKDQVALAAWPDHPLAGKTISAEKLAGEPLVMREPGSGTRAFALKVLEAAGLDSTQMTIAGQFGSTMAVIQAVRAKVGLGFVSLLAIQEEIQAGRLAQVRVTGLDLIRHFYLATLTKRSHSPAAQALIDFCREHFGSLGRGGA